MKPMARRRSDTPTCVEMVIYALLTSGCILVYILWSITLGAG